MTRDIRKDRVGGPLPSPAATFHLRAIPFCPVAQRVMLALAARGTGWTVEEIPGTFLSRPDLPQLTVQIPGGAQKTFDKSIAMIEAVEALHPDQPLYPDDPALRRAERALMELGRGLQIRLSAVTHAQDSVENDIAIHHLRQRLILIEQSLTQVPEVVARPLSNAGVVFCPTLWRIFLVDRWFQTYLMTGLPVLSRWGRGLIRQPAVQSVLDEDSERLYLALLRQRGAPLVSQLDADLWQPILGLRGPHQGAG